MRTIVFQSFRTQNVPPWISACLNSVRQWAAQKDFDYQFWDDSFFDLVPADLRPRASTHVCLLTDYARIAAARKYLNQGWDRAIWVDADAVIFDPKNFEITLISGFAFCREIWHDFTLFGRPLFKLNVNNSVSVFCRDEKLIAFYLEQARSILLGKARLSAVSIGTEWLLNLRRTTVFPLLTTVGVLGPELMYRYLHDDGRFLGPLLKYQTSPVYALNLCNSKNGEVYRFAGVKTTWVLNDETLLQVVQRLLSDQGKSLNAHFKPSYAPPADEFRHPLFPWQDRLRRWQIFLSTKLPGFYRWRKSRAPTATS